MIVGSSMTQRAFDLKYLGFGIGLCDWYSRLADVFLRGQSGYNTRWTLATLPDMIGSHKPDMAIIFLGNNDSITVGNEQAISLEEYRSNMTAIMTTFRKVNSDTILLLLTPTRATKVGRSDSVTSLYTDIVRELGEQDDRSAVVDLWDGEHAIVASDLCDGLHLNIEGNRKVLMAIKSTITSNFDCMVPSYDEASLKLRRANTAAQRANSGASHSDTKEQTIVADSCPRLKWKFPHWSELSGKSVEESSEILQRARTRSFL